MDNENLIKTSLSHVHEALGAKMVPFAGYWMPVQYSGLVEEHLAVRSSLGVFDVSHMGEFILRGENALALIQKVTSNDAAKLFDGKVQYSCMPNGKGGIVDDLLVYRIRHDEYLLVVNASNILKDWNWISSHNDMGVEMQNISSEMSLLAVQGPLALKAMQKLTSLPLLDMEYYTFHIGEFAGFENIIVSTTGYTGSGGCEIYFPNSAAESIWNQVFDAGKEFGIRPIGLGARDTLRLEMGFCLYGNDIDDTTSPLEAGLGWITKLSKEFVDAELLRRQKSEGVKRKLVGFEMMDRGIPRHGYEVTNGDGKVIGHVTSGTQSPSTQKAIGMAYVTTDFAETGKDIFIHIRGKNLRAKVCKMPFYVV